jgi:hypothetical protein
MTFLTQFDLCVNIITENVANYEAVINQTTNCMELSPSWETPSCAITLKILKTFYGT